LNKKKDGKRTPHPEKGKTPFAWERDTLNRGGKIETEKGFFL